MKKYLPNLGTLILIFLFILLGQSGQSNFAQKTSLLANELVSELIIVFIGITIGLFITDFITALIGASIIACGAFACVYFGFFVNRMIQQCKIAYKLLSPGSIFKYPTLIFPFPTNFTPKSNISN